MVVVVAEVVVVVVVIVVEEEVAVVEEVVVVIVVVVFTMSIFETLVNVMYAFFSYVLQIFIASVFYNRNVRGRVSFR